MSVSHIEHNILFMVLHCLEKKLSQMFEPCGQGWTRKASRLSAKCKGRPSILRSMQQAAILWLLILPNLPDGGLITGTACSSSPGVSPPSLDTMQDAKLCFSMYWTFTRLFAQSICFFPSLIHFRSMLHWTPCFLSLCCLLYSNIRENDRENLE